jgi:DNA-binding MarR family transcriptional regulator
MHPHLELMLSLSADQRAAWLGFLDVHNRMVKELDDELEREHGLSLSTFSVLATLTKSPDRRLRMSELADNVLISRPGMTRLIERLERDGLVERRRSETDSRQVYAQITERGLARLGDAAKTHFQGVRTRFLDHLSATQTQELARAWITMLGERPPYFDVERSIEPELPQPTGDPPHGAHARHDDSGDSDTAAKSPGSDADRTERTAPSRPAP